MLRSVLPAASAAALLTLSPALADDGNWALVVHGGAGVIERDSMTPETDAAYRAAMHAALVAAPRRTSGSSSHVTTDGL